MRKLIMTIILVTIELEDYNYEAWRKPGVK